MKCTVNWNIWRDKYVIFVILAKKKLILGGCRNVLSVSFYINDKVKYLPLTYQPSVGGKSSVEYPIKKEK
ncbi:hypothetical protein PIROE2DRAFT_17740 [Piromyces sp. E2]|nr:hypothetical protein PIROE2DRAFT_17740 [Piromyces sp. E2]|eukprot:OUM57317.1 hypothetical protein PIROE2DRAFT_17740 [Piromyces sp. E2]